MNLSTTFDPVRVGLSATPKTLLVQNIGYGDLELSDQAQSGSNDITIPEIEDTIIPTNKGIEVTAEFEPESPGWHRRYVTMATNDIENPMLVLEWEGFALAPVIGLLDPGSDDMVSGESEITFYGGYSGTLAHALAFTIKNVGNYEMVGITVAGSGDFIATNLDITELGIGEEATFRVGFFPTGPFITTKNGTISVTSDATNSPFTFDVSGSCWGEYFTGDPPLFGQILVETILPFDAVEIGQFSEITPEVANIGAGFLYVSEIEITGTHAADFTINPNYGFILNPSENRYPVVTFTPSAIGVRSAQIVFHSNDPANPTITQDLEGEGYV